MKAKIGSHTLTEKPIIHGSHPCVIVNKKVDVGNGDIAAGELLGKDADSEMVPYKESDAVAMTGTINGSNTDFTHTFAVPIEPGSVVIDNDNTSAQQLTDDEHGALVGDGTGSVKNYDGGAEVAVTFTTAPESGKTVTIKAKPAFEGVSLQALSTDQVEAEDVDDAGPVIVHGTVVGENLSAGGSAIGDADKATLKKHGIWAL